MHILPIIVKTYASVKDRLDRYKVLGLCTLCTDPRHLKVKYRGKNDSSDLAGITKGAAMPVPCVPV